MKKILIIIGSVIVFLGILFVVYWFFVPGKIAVTSNIADSKISINNSSSGTGSASQQLKRGQYEIKVEKEGYASYIKRVDILGFQTKEVQVELKKLPEPTIIEKGVTTLDKDNDNKNLLVGEKSGAQFGLMMPEANTKQQISRIDFGQSVKAKWSANKFLVYIWRKDGSSGLVDLKRYDLLNQEFHPWPKGVVDLAWSHKGDQVAYFYKPGDGEFSLITSSPVNQGVERLLLHLDRRGITNPYLEWTKSDNDLLIVDKDIYVYNFYSHELKKLTKTEDVKVAKLSFSGKYILYSTKSGSYLSRLDGTEVRKLGGEFETFSWLPNGEEILGFNDGTWEKINAATGQKTEYGYNGAKIKNAKDIVVLNDGKTVYYLINDVLYGLKLQPKIEVGN